MSRPDNTSNSTISFAPATPQGNNPLPLKGSPGSKPKSSSNTIPSSISFLLWVTKIAQSNKLQGPMAQSFKTRHFYPRSYGPGDYQITGIAKSQKNYQDLAKFIRSHHETLLAGSNLLGTPHSRSDLLMGLDIPGENIHIRGWISRFTLTKVGVFAPVPTYTFLFTIGLDQRSKQNISVSDSITKWYAPSQDDIRDGVSTTDQGTFLGTL